MKETNLTILKAFGAVMVIALAIGVSIYRQTAYAKEVSSIKGHKVVSVERISFVPKRFEVVLDDNSHFLVRGRYSKYAGRYTPRTGYTAYVEDKRIIFQKSLTGTKFPLSKEL